MAENIFLAFFLLLSVYGICELIHTVRSKLLSLRGGNNNYCVILLKKGKAIGQLLYAKEQQLWNGKMFCTEIIAVDTDLEENEREECLVYAANNDISFIPADMLPHVLEYFT